MLSDEREARLIVVKRSVLPASFVVALFALRAFLSFVLVIFLVAAVTIERGILIPVFCVTVFARYIPVLPSKRVLRLVVIKADLFPGIVGMAIRAGLSRSSLVFIVFLVAGVASGRRLSILHFGLVASFTANLFSICMCAAEGKIGF